MGSEEKKSNAGQPPVFKSPEELQLKIDSYFEHIKGEWHWKAADVDKGEKENTKEWDRLPEPCTITGLALFLGFSSRQSIYDYGNRGEYSYIIKNAQFRVEHEYEKSAMNAKNPTFQIFALKNMGWKDKTETDITTGGEKIETRPRIEFVSKTKK